MTIIDQKEQKCAVCGHTFSSNLIRSTLSTGESYLDFCPAMARMTLGLEISMCPNCHYVSTDIERPVSDETKEFVLSNPAFKETHRYYDRTTNYINLMRIALLEERYHDAFSACLKAAWAKEAAGSIREPLGSFKIRCEALELFEKYEDKLRFNKDTRLCIKADLLRRTAQFEEVIEYVLSANPTSEQAKYILQFQEHLAKERDSRSYLVSQAYEWKEENGYV